MSILIFSEYSFFLLLFLPSKFYFLSIRIYQKKIMAFDIGTNIDKQRKTRI